MSKLVDTTNALCAEYFALDAQEKAIKKRKDEIKNEIIEIANNEPLDTDLIDMHAKLYHGTSTKIDLTLVSKCRATTYNKIKADATVKTETWVLKVNKI